MKISMKKLCEYLIYLYIIIIMMNGSTGNIAVKSIRIILLFFLTMNIIKSGKVHNSSYNIWAILFLGYNAMMINHSFSRTGAIAGFLTLLYVLVENLLIYQFIIKNDILKGIMKSIILGSILLACYVFIRNGLLVFINSRFVTDNSANTIGLYSSISIAFILFLKEQFSKGNNTKYNIILIVNFLIILFSASRKALVFALIILAIYYISKSKNTLKLMKNIIIGAVLIASILIFIFKNPFLYKLIGNRIETMIYGIQGEKTDSSTSARLKLINAGIKWFHNKPWFGHGPANFRYLNLRYRNGNFYAHNNYIEMLVDYGIIGTVLYYYLYILIIYNFFKRGNYKNKSNFVLLGILISILICEYGLVSYYNSILQLILMILVFLVSNNNDEGKLNDENQKTN